MLRMGVCVTINSDDPAYFGGYMNQNFVATVNALDLTAAEAKQLAANSFEASFITPEQRAGYMARLEHYSQANGA